MSAHEVIICEALTPDPSLHPDLQRSVFDALDALTALVAERDMLRRRLTAHHDIATLSDEVLREYDFYDCPVCVRALVSA